MPPQHRMISNDSGTWNTATVVYNSFCRAQRWSCLVVWGHFCGKTGDFSRSGMVRESFFSENNYSINNIKCSACHSFLCWFPKPHVWLAFNLAEGMIFAFKWQTTPSTFNTFDNWMWISLIFTQLSKHSTMQSFWNKIFYDKVIYIYGKAPSCLVRSGTLPLFYVGAPINKS